MNRQLPRKQPELTQEQEVQELELLMLLLQLLHLLLLPPPGSLFQTSSGGNSSNVSYRLSARKFIFLKSKMIPTSLVTPEMIHAWSRQLLFLCRCSSVNSSDQLKWTKEKRRVWGSDLGSVDPLNIYQNQSVSRSEVRSILPCHLIQEYIFKTVWRRENIFSENPQSIFILYLKHIRIMLFNWQCDMMLLILMFKISWA